MSHEIESAFFVKEAAWHRLGTVLQNAPSIEEALAVAGLDWDVEKRPLYVDSTASVADDRAGGDLDQFMSMGEPAPSIVQVPGYMAHYRQSDDSFLGIVTNNYKTLQNIEALAAYAPLVEDGTLVLEAGGSLMGGKKCWLLARFADNAEVKDGDVLIPYLLLAWGHDGKSGILTALTVTRVVCWNTLQAAGFREGNPLTGQHSDNRITVAHTGNVAKKVAEAARCVALARASFKKTVDVYKAMADKPVDVQTVKDFAREVFDADYVKAVNLIPKLKAKVKEAEAFQARKMGEAIAELEAMVQDRETKPSLMERAIVKSFEEGPGHELAGSTVYGLVNAATDYIDHERSNGDEASLKSSWFGAGAQLRKDAFDKALALL
jgi:phage/plasmid-like protein (TIGR03299 family)